jgi:hypothetical protein
MADFLIRKFICTFLFKKGGKMRISSLIVFCALFLGIIPQSICAQLSPRRQRIMDIAESFRTHQWTAEQHHIYGTRTDVNGMPMIQPIQVKVGNNIGMPYGMAWDTPESFDKAMSFQGALPGAQHECASIFPRGVDCSGLVSHCLELTDKAGTSTFPELCYELPSWQDLQPGDIVNFKGTHARLFKEYRNAEKTLIRTYENGAYTLCQDYPEATLNGYYKPLRYKPLDSARFAAERMPFENPTFVGTPVFKGTGSKVPNTTRISQLLTFIPASSKNGYWVEYAGTRNDSLVTGYSTNVTRTTKYGVKAEGATNTTVHFSKSQDTRLTEATIQFANATTNLLSHYHLEFMWLGYPVITSTIETGICSLGTRVIPAKRVEAVLQSFGRFGNQSDVTFSAVYSDSIPLSGIISMDYRYTSMIDQKFRNQTLVLTKCKIAGPTTKTGMAPPDHGRNHLSLNVLGSAQRVSGFHFHLNRPDRISLGVFDVSGKLVQRLSEGYREKGEHRIRFNGSRLQNGVYFVRLSTPDNSIAKRVVIIK